MILPINPERFARGRGSRFRLTIALTLILSFVGGAACTAEEDPVETQDYLIGGLVAVAYPYLIEPCAITTATHTGPIAPITSGYGSAGTNTVAVRKFANPGATDRAVCVYHPAGQTAATSTIFFTHGFSAPSAEPYMPLIEFLVSKGYVVVYPVYYSDNRDPTLNYAVMKAGIEAAVTNYTDLIDTTRVGYMGHSYGGGAVPYLAYEGIKLKGWGAAGSFMYMMAPWYSFLIDNTQLGTFSAGNTRFLAQVYEEDATTDHRMAKDIFDNIGIAAAEKEYVELFTDTGDGYTLTADHWVPTKAIITGGGAYDGMDFYGVFRLLDALADYSFNGTAAGKTTALGNNNSTQQFMGTFSTGTAVKVLQATDAPVVTRAESTFSAPFSGSLNPRK